MSQPAVTPKNAAELLQHVELTGIQVYAVVGRRETESAPSSGAEPELAIRLSQGGLETRMRVSVQTNEALLESDMGVVYSFKQPVNLWSTVVTEFIERVATMAVYPFVRESIYTTALRMGVDAPVLGLMRAGEFSMGATEGPQFAASRAPATAGDLAKEFGVSTKRVRTLLEQNGIALSTGRERLSEDDSARIRAAVHVDHALG